MCFEQHAGGLSRFPCPCLCSACDTCVLCFKFIANLLVEPTPTEVNGAVTS